MFTVRASACTRADLQRAFDEYAAAHTHDVAVMALERATGARDVPSVPDGRIINGLTELICGFSFVGCDTAKREQSAADRITRLHDGLARIGADAFARMKAPAKRA